MNKRIDKKRKKLIVNTSKVKQRFGIRKLTTGVTSVLLGAFLIWGGQPLLKQQKVRLQMIMRNLAILVTILQILKM
ncbi:YSIRK-type signal peptide-containing protein [Limosilactobacillus vaginalis]|uniref:YSIRK-type signal peptide-containing protein n=1 Tax=Limosilactobacillus vaginalis TaxID=1633 RepID=UPI0039C5B52C